jgi:hypothetical protein
MIDLLARENPAALASLRERYPTEAKVFSSERLLGHKEPTPGLTAAQKVARTDLISSYLTTGVSELDKLAIAVKSNMKMVSRIRLAGSIMASVSGAIAAILALFLNNASIQAATAILAAAGGISSATAEQWERAPSGVRISAAEEYGKIVEMRSKLENMRTKIQRDNIIPLTDQEVVSMVEESERYAGDILRLKMT